MRIECVDLRADDFRVTLIVAGIDPSLTATGIACVFDVGQDVQVACATMGRKGHTADSLAERGRRLRDLRGQILDVVAGAQLAVIEGPSLHSVGGATHDRSGLWWLVVEALLAEDVPVAVVPPATRAKWATGSGRAKKADVIAAMAARFPQVSVGNDNEADALALATLGMVKLGRAMDRATLAQLSTVTKVAWPAEGSTGGAFS